MTRQRSATRHRSLPSASQHLAVLWHTNRLLARQRLGLTQARLQRVLSLLALVPAAALGCLSYWFMTHQNITQATEVSQFYLNLLCFITAMLWITWPVMSAGVEDASDSQRFQAYPVSIRRLLVASTLSSLLRPVSLFMFAPLLGAVVGYSVSHVVRHGWLVPLLACSFLLMCAGWSQAALYWVRDVLRSKRNGQALGLLLIGLIALGIILPPVDISWIYQERTSDAPGGIGLDLEQYTNIAYAFSRVPAGYLGEGLRALHDLQPQAALVDAAAMLLLAALGLLTAQVLLSHTSQGKASYRQESPSAQRVFLWTRTPLATLTLREILSLWRNPRARLLCAIPFVLMVLLRLFSAHALIVHFGGNDIDHWLMAVLAAYAVTLIASTFAFNSFGDDGQGLFQLLAAPVSPHQILSAKCRAQAGLMLTVGLGSCGFYSLYIHAVDSGVFLLVSLGIFVMVCLSIPSALLLSVHFPANTDSRLNHRARQPLAIATLGLLICLLAAAPLFIALQCWQLGNSIAVTGGGLGIALCLTLAIICRFFPLLASQLENHRETLLARIGRF